MPVSKRLLSVMMVSVVFSVPAYADKDNGNGRSLFGQLGDWLGGSDRGEGRGKPAHAGKIKGIGSSDRAIIQRYMAQHYRPNCPPGLAKKNNGCLPPGQAKKLYRLGQPLPGAVNLGNLPQSLLNQLSVPPGHRYGMVDRDVVLISEATRSVVDAITLMSAINQ